VKLCGLNACRAIFRHRPDDIVRVYLTEQRLPELRDVLQWCAKERRAYHIVAADELARITQSTHHEGVCILARRMKQISLRELRNALSARQTPHCVLMVEGVGNPHNLGAIARVAAHFGAAALILAPGDGADLPTLSAATHRTAEGGLEAVSVSYVSDAVRAARDLVEDGYTLAGTSSHAGASLYAASLPDRVVFLLGSESEGLSPALLAETTECLAIPGTGAVESLNVACATAVLCAEFSRTHAG
jgi:TrmH RNA methyltransferase